MPADFTQIEWDAAAEAHCRQLVAMALLEDVRQQADWTSAALIPSDALGRAAVVARRAGVIAGLPAGGVVCGAVDRRIEWRALVAEGSKVEAGATVATLAGPSRGLLMAERTLLNMLSRLSGIATLTRQFVDAAAGTKARIYDTRKTTAGWRRLEKYAVRQGGGWNHRFGLFDAVLIKDNHLAMLAARAGRLASPGEAVRQARAYLATARPADAGPPPITEPLPIEVEVDTLDQLRDALSAGPDLVLLDNMLLDEMRQAVAIRDATAPAVELEASGGVRLETIGDISRAGVDRVSVGALTHSAVALDLGLDWLP